VEKIHKSNSIRNCNEKCKIILAALLTVTALLMAINRPSAVQGIKSFDDCVKAGYPILESYPRQCKTPDGRNFVEEPETQQTPRGPGQGQVKFIDAHLQTPFQLWINQTAVIESENRCPSTVVCVWEGQARVVIGVLNRGDFILVRREGHEDLAASRVDGYIVRLVKADPYPWSTWEIEKAEYIVTHGAFKAYQLSW
jgi:hypothetical protein